MKFTSYQIEIFSSDKNVINSYSKTVSKRNLKETRKYFLSDNFCVQHRYLVYTYEYFTAYNPCIYVYKKKFTLHM